MNKNISLITKEYFYNSLKISVPIEFEKYSNNSLNKFDEITKLKKDEDLIMPYFKTRNNYFFVYLNSLNLILIPRIYKNQTEILDEIRKSYLDLSNWEILKISDDVPYIKNTYLRAEHDSLGLVYEPGTYIINNIDTKEQFEFSIYTEKSPYCVDMYDSYLGYKEIAYNDDLIRTDDIYKKEQLFELILENNGRCYIKKSDSKSE